MVLNRILSDKCNVTLLALPHAVDLIDLLLDHLGRGGTGYGLEQGDIDRDGATDDPKN